MKEILPGIHTWTGVHDVIKMDVSSYYVEPARSLIDPMVPPDVGLDWFAEDGREPPEQILLTNRHHYRHSDRFRERFGDLPVRVISVGLHEFEGTDRKVETFEFGDELAPGITAIEVGGICPDDGALEIEIGGGTIAMADALIRYAPQMMFVPDSLMDDPEKDKAAMLASFRKLLERDFDNLLFAHGDPLVGGAKEQLQKFVDEPLTAATPSG
jgi:glyoxylase-like metal-dependent hydrolase (beta-lactamase superfamily II)